MRRVWCIALIPAFGLLAACDDSLRVPYTGSAMPQANTAAAAPAAVVATPPAATVVTVPAPATQPMTIVTAPQVPPVVTVTPPLPTRSDNVTLCGGGMVYSPRLGYCVEP